MPSETAITQPAEQLLQAIYPRLLRRIRALLIDTLLLMAILWLWWISLEIMGDIPPQIRLAIPITLLFLIDPVMVSLTGGTPGHHLMGLRVIRRTSLQDSHISPNLNLLQATLRSGLKLTVGIATFLFVLLTRHHQALHDLLARSVVVLKRPEHYPAHEKFPERHFPTHLQPAPLWRRIGMMCVYNLLVFITLTLITSFVVSPACLERETCSVEDNIWILMISFSWLFLSGWSVVRCWHSQAPGCRARAIR